MHATLDLIAAYSPLLADATGFTTQIRNFIAPFALITVSVLALTFLVRRQFMQVLVFAIIAVIVFAIFYAPEMLTNLGKSAGDANKSTLTW